ncbi:MAG: ABC transporter ATP-binding protein [Spirochaetales bacterium]|nr:ABC transporter ATP-binding protein [Spirochaetales bacterium]
MLIVAAALTLNSAAGSAGPILLSTIIDLVAKNPSLAVILAGACGVVLLGVLGWLFNYIRQRLTATVIGDVVLKLRSDVFEKTIQHDLSFYDSHPSGKIVSRITSDTQDFTEVVSLIMDLLSQVILVLILVVWLFILNATLTLILLAMAPVAVIIALRFRKIARKVTRQAKRVRAKINAQIQESISGIMVAKAFRKEKSLFRQFSENNRQAYSVGLRRGIIINIIFPIINMAGALGTALIMYTAGMAVHDGGMSVGTWYLFMQTVGFFWYPLLSIASFWSQFQDGLSASERVFSLIDREPNVIQTGNDRLSSVRGNIEFDRVCFSYNENESVLCDFSLLINHGETVALVGHTGAGKSSIARLITRFYEFQKGRILLDGIDIRSLDLVSYRRHVGLVPQDPFLFSGTVADNIRYGRPEATESDVCYAATHLGNGEWIDDLPRGLATDVGHRGSNLSMGQRQLVALARVLLKNPAIFILDEATASVDPFTEVQIQEGLSTVMKSRTAVIIAHRLSTIKKADRILMMKEGSIIEEGNHASLLASGGSYADLYNTYFRHQSPEYIEQRGE